MEKHVEVIKDYFVDYAGNKHNFVIAAISEELDVPHRVAMKVGAGYLGPMFSPVDEVVKAIKIGIAICNPLDNYDEELGVVKAVGRARKAIPSIWTKEKGYINAKTVNALLTSEAEYLKKNPEKYIAGYEDAHNKWLEKHQMDELAANFNSIQKVMVEEGKKNPEFIGDVQRYLEYKCKK